MLTTDEVHLPRLQHSRAGSVGLLTDCRWTASEIYITMSDGLESLDGKHTLFGFVAEGFSYIQKMHNLALLDDNNRPLQLHRINKAHVLEDPFQDLLELDEVRRILPAMLPRAATTDRITLDPTELLQVDSNDIAQRIERLEEATERARSQILTGLGDLPDAEVKPPENVIFICKLNPVTDETGLSLLFSQFGKVVSCDIIRDKTTGDSLCYGFIEFETKDSAERAFLKMNDVLVDHHRIQVDFSQSVAKLFLSRKFKRAHEASLRRSHHDHPKHSKIANDRKDLKLQRKD